MKACVVGLWHLGSVTAACLASFGHEITGLDFDEAVIENFQRGKPPIFEPGLESLVSAGLQNGNLAFTSDPAAALLATPLVWIAYDTPVDEDDNADVEYVVGRIEVIIRHAEPQTLIIVSSQLPVGTSRRLEALAQDLQKDISFAYSPENLRLGKAIDVFLHPDRIIFGVRTEKDKQNVRELLGVLSEKIEWMAVESAEMTKHALNAFLATSVVFINEIAVLCEKVGADAKDVERGLKTEARIGPKAYLGPGGAFAGGTLARDINFLIDLGKQHASPVHVFTAVKESNEAHKLWPRHKLIQEVGDLRQKTVAVWGLTYKPGTDTLRRSSSVELCRWLVDQGANVRAYDPAVQELPASLANIHLCESAAACLVGASALVIATEWPDFRSVDPRAVERMTSAVVIDANGFLTKTFEAVGDVQYIRVGRKVGGK